MKQTTFLMAFLMLFSIMGFGQATDLIISEYGEGSSNNKYIEIYNGTGSTVDLSQYQLWRVSNGGTWPEATYDFQAATLADGEVITIANNDTDTPGADEYNSGFCSWNGDDAVGLAKNDGSGAFVLIDAVGTDGADPGSGWEVAGIANATKDHYLVRKETVCSPNTDWTISAGTNSSDSEWIVDVLAGSPPATFGSHTANCSTSSPLMLWNGDTFNEASANDGSIGDTITVSLLNETFAATPATELTEGNDYTVANVPDGLTIHLVVTTDTSVAIGFTGNANSHADADDVSNLTINFLDNAFTSSTIPANASKDNLVIDFIDAVEMTWNDTAFVEAVANDGSIQNPVTVSLSGETFALTDTLEQGTHYLATNVPAGLSVEIVTTSTTEATIYLRGNATSHLDADDIDNLTIAFLNDAFTGGDASAVAYSTKDNLVVDFNDPYPTPDLIITEIMYNNPGTDTLEFIEIFNNETTDANIDGFYMAGVTYTFNNVIIPAQSYIVLTVDSLNMLDVFGINAYQWTSGGLSNGGEAIAIYNQGGELIDSVNYDDNNGWPTDADGGGYSLVFCDYSLDNNMAENWMLSESYNANGLYASPMELDSACLPHPEMTWTAYTFNEASNNDGSIANSITVNLVDETFATVGTLTQGTDYNIYNLPAGLTADITTTDNVTAVVTLNGNATNHDNADDVNNLAIHFLNDAFTGGDSTVVVNSSIDTLKIDFNDTPIVPEMTWNDSVFVEAVANDGSIANSISVTLTGETFVTSNDTLTEGVEYTVANVPAGLTAVIVINDDYNASIYLNGNANDHGNADDIDNLTVVFNDAAFTGGDASAVVNSSKQDIYVDFMDPYITPNLVISEIMYNPPEGGTDSLEFVEIYNNDTFDVNLNNYYFDGFTYIFGDVVIPQGDRIVVCVNSNAMMNTFGINAYQWTSGGLSNGGEPVAIYNPGGDLVDEVVYDDNSDWPDADGSGHSLVLCDINADNNDFANWTISTNYVTDNADGESIWASPGQSDNVCTTNPELTWSTTTFVESSNDDGSISTVADLTLTDDEFTVTGILTEGTHYTVANVPAGLQVVITTSSANNATVELTGNATNHTDADDVADMEITFTDTAFVSGFAANVVNSSLTDLIVDFSGTTGIVNIDNENINIYPNPAKDMVSISGNNITKVEFFDLTGKKINIKQNNGQYDLSTAKEGAYFVKIYSNNNIVVKKLIIE